MTCAEEEKDILKTIRGEVNLHMKQTVTTNRQALFHDRRQDTLTAACFELWMDMVPLHFVVNKTGQLNNCCWHCSETIMCVTFYHLEEKETLLK